jgi:hypothetical protein
MKATCQHLVEDALTDMAKRRVPKIVSKPDRFDKVLIEIQPTSDRPANLCNLDHVGQPSSEMVALRRNKYLTFVLQAPERVRVNNPVSVPLKLGAGRSRIFWNCP